MPRVIHAHHLLAAGMFLAILMGTITVDAIDRWDSLIQYYAEKHVRWRFPWQVMKAQMLQESGGKSLAASPVGAAGLFQLMPSTDRGIDGELDGMDTDGNVEDAALYMADLWDRFAELPDPVERLKATLAAYNGGRGYVNASLALARLDQGLPESFSDWVLAGRPPGDWQRFVVWSTYLKDDRCVVHGKHPDAQQIIDYVTRILDIYTGRLGFALPS